MEAAKIEVSVRPGSSRNSVEMAEDGRLKVHVTDPPERGKANAAVVALLAKRLGVPKSSIRIVRGHRAGRKLLLIEGLSAEAAARRLGAL